MHLRKKEILRRFVVQIKDYAHDKRITTKGK